MKKRKKVNRAAQIERIAKELAFSYAMGWIERREPDGQCAITNRILNENRARKLAESLFDSPERLEVSARLAML